MSDFRDYLLDIYGRRRDLRGAYSMRSYARDLGLSPSRLSEVLGQRRQRLSRSSAERIAGRLDLSEKERSRFLALVDMENPWHERVRRSAKKGLRQLASYQDITDDELTFIGCWRHGAIFEALALGGCQAIASADEQVTWLCRRLSLAPLEVRGCLRRLTRLKLVRQAGGRYTRAADHFATKADVPSEAVRRVHAEFLQKATEALRAQPVPRRSFNTFLLSIDSARLPEAKERLARFCRDFDEEFGAKGNTTDVYCLATQMFAITNEDAGHERK